MRKNTDLKGVIGAAVTPVDVNLAIDAARLAAHCRKMLDEGCAFTSVFGTTGEGASLSAQQKTDALDIMVTAGFDMQRQIVGIIASSVDDAACLYRKAAAIGCRAALIIPPFYYEASDNGVVDFFDAVVKAAGAPDLDIVLYNFPVFSGVTFTPQLIQNVCLRLGTRVVGIKDSTGDLANGLKLIALFPDLSIFTGDARILSRLVITGGAGMIAGLVNVFPADCVTLYGGQVASKLEELIVKRVKIVNDHGGLVALKSLLAELYSDPTYARPLPPLLALADEIQVKSLVQRAE